MMSEQLVSDSPQRSGTADSDETRFLDLLIILAQHKKLVIGLPLFTGTLALVISLLITPTFLSSATIMPPQQVQSAGLAAILGQIGGLSGVTGGMDSGGNPTELYVGLLESRTVADSLIARFKLKERYDQTMQGTRDALRNNTEIRINKGDGMIVVSVSDRDPQFAADLANGYVDELSKLTQTMALTEASQRRLFFEQQLKTVKDQLASAEITLRTTQEKTGMVQPAAQVQAIIGNAAQLKGTIAAKEVELKAMRTFATAQNPELLRTQEELRGLQIQLEKLEKAQPSQDGDFLVPTGKLPEVGVEYVRSLREVKYYETIFELLAKQFELAKIDEAKNAAQIQLLDKAIPAEHKSKPKRALITVVGGLFGLVLGMLLAFVHAGYINSRKNAESERRWQRLSAAMGRRSAT